MDFSSFTCISLPIFIYQFLFTVFVISLACSVIFSSQRNSFSSGKKQTWNSFPFKHLLLNFLSLYRLSYFHFIYSFFLILFPPIFCFWFFFFLIILFSLNQFLYGAEKWKRKIVSAEWRKWNDHIWQSSVFVCFFRSLFIIMIIIALREGRLFPSFFCFNVCVNSKIAFRSILHNFEYSGKRKKCECLV